MRQHQVTVVGWQSHMRRLFFDTDEESNDE
jgi:hypothetical protein